MKRFTLCSLVLALVFAAGALTGARHHDRINFRVTALSGWLPQSFGETSGEPRLVTAAQVKSFWISNLPKTQSLDRDFHTKEQSRQAVIGNIESGSYDGYARRKALEWNLKECLRADNKKQAAETQAELDRLSGNFRSFPGSWELESRMMTLPLDPSHPAFQ